MDQKVLMIIGVDRLVKDDVSPAGLHRRHIIRYGGLPDLDAWLYISPDHAKGWTYIDDHGDGHLWLAWKD